MAIKKKFTIKKAKLIGDKLAVNWTDFDAKQFRMGLEVEQEHGKIKRSSLNYSYPPWPGPHPELSRPSSF